MPRGMISFEKKRIEFSIELIRFINTWNIVNVQFAISAISNPYNDFTKDIFTNKQKCIVVVDAGFFFSIFE